MRFFISLFFLLAGLNAAVAQALPNHVDPSAREILPNLTPIPAIRFLTTADFPPFNFRDAGGALIGFNIDLARRICAEADVACTVQAWPWAQAADALADNQGDALIAGLAMTSADGDRFDFSATYLALPGRFVAASGAIGNFDPEKLAGKTIAVRTGSAHQTFINRYLPDAKLVPFGDEIQALTALKDNQVDLYFGDAMRASFWLNDNPGFGFAGQPYFRPDLFGPGMTIAVNADHDAVRHAIDLALVKLENSGALDEPVSALVSYRILLSLLAPDQTRSLGDSENAVVFGHPPGDHCPKGGQLSLAGPVAGRIGSKRSHDRFGVGHLEHVAGNCNLDLF
ncbi:transporter substrate-binding domain-containing protein [Devosia algicola]|uniref:Transporter substrate-binding domain-containing protein n=1 Tax=Devosia algicola TaxID=3026418 RepID=A0ABY7YN37_9HYPH|nr:transporter substrate-binding domain-containing protein [Devosia algicola]WDR02612.1 transporter substrate-binding domain-containing protein [Devosia algicola]